MAERVVDVAEALVQQAGYNGFSYDDVAQQVGIRKPSIHHHFPTKAELVVTVVQRYAHRFCEQLLRIEGRRGAAGEQLSAYADLFEATYLQNRRLCVCGMLGAEAEGLPPDVAAEVQRFFEVNLEWLRRVFSAGQADGSLRAQAQAPDALAELYLCALEGAMVVGRGAPASHGPAATGRALISLMVV